MRQAVRALAVGCAIVCSSVALGQAMSGARQAGEDLATAIRDATSSTILGSTAPGAIPGFGGTSFPESAMVDDPDALTAAGETRRTDDLYLTIIDPARPSFDPATIDLASAELVEDDPDAYLGTSISLDGSTGSCEALPDTGTAPSTYYDSCNEGSQASQYPLNCAVRQKVVVDIKHHYACESLQIVRPAYTFCSDFRRGVCHARTNVPELLIETVSTCAAAEADPTCSPAGSSVVDQGPFWAGQQNQDDNLRRVRRETKSFTCTTQHAPATARQSSAHYYTVFGHLGVPNQGSKTTWTAAAETYGGQTGMGATSTIDDGDCLSRTAGQSCGNSVDVCVDASPQTRVINGVPVTHTCWEWQRTYDCANVTSNDDCSALRSDPRCSFDRRECLSQNRDGTCNLWDVWYRCASGGGGGPSGSRFVCAGDLYCIDGECTTIDRQASTEFKDAMVAVQTMGELRDDFDPATLRLFTGEDLKCTRKIFGLSNCCSGKGVPLLTPWLCNAEDRVVDQKDDAGLCHYIGSYCSASILGVCTTRKQSYCCYSSKLTRILQEQGRAQLGLNFGTPKDPVCEGFLIDEFQRLDLSLMDFSEVYAEFAAAARLPDEIAAGVLIQQKIADYYALHTAP